MKISGTVGAVSMGGVDLTEFVSHVDFELSPWQRDILADLPQAEMSIGFRGSWEPARSWAWGSFTRAYDLWGFFAAARARRLSRMRAAYRRKRR